MSQLRLHGGVQHNISGEEARALLGSIFPWRALWSTLASPATSFLHRPLASTVKRRRWLSLSRNRRPPSCSCGIEGAPPASLQLAQFRPEEGLLWAPYAVSFQ